MDGSCHVESALKKNIIDRKMDASQYLRRLKESCTQTLGRPKCMDAGLRTQIVRNSAMSGVTSEVAPKNQCCLKPMAGYDGAVTPILPPAGCVSKAACDDMERRYTEEPIILPGCPIPYTTATYVGGNSYKYQSTRTQKAEAERLRAIKEFTRPVVAPVQGYLAFTRGILRTPIINGFNIGTGAFTVEWFQKLNPIETFTSSDTYFYTLFSIGDVSTIPEQNAITFYLQVSPPNPITTYSVYVSQGSEVAPYYFGDFGTLPTSKRPLADLVNNWLHFALVGDGASPTNTIRLYVNGAQFGSAFTNYDFTVTDQPYLSIGGITPLNNQYYFNGCLTNFRFTKGEALYTDTFTPPSAPLPLLASSQILFKTMSDAPAEDSSSPRKLITPIGPLAFAEDSPF